MSDEYMCPFCVNPWKCNGPHIEPEDMVEFEAYSRSQYDFGFRDALDAAEQAVKAHSDDTHRHKGDYFGLCRVDAGDRCDITAALTVVASNIRALKEKP